MAESAGRPFIWLTCTNKGASEVCEPALEQTGISRVQLQSGYLCDPASKSDLRILARPGVVLRLTRNLDKRRGFVNGVTAIVEEPLRGNSVFTARLVGTGKLVLVHPITEKGPTFLPCCYGYATTIRHLFKRRSGLGGRGGGARQGWPKAPGATGP